MDGAEDGVPRLVLASAVLAKVRGGIGSGRRLGLARASTGGLGWYYVHAEGSGATLQDRGQLAGTRGLHKDAALASYSRARMVLFGESGFLAVGGQFHDLVKRTKNRLRGRRARSEERLVAPNLWATLSVHVVASPASHAALEVGALTVHS